MTDQEEFEISRAQQIELQAGDPRVRKLSNEWAILATEHKYTYNFSFLGRPILQSPEDMIVYQEVVWRVKPNIVIETGIAHGGSIIHTASLLALLDYADAVQSNLNFNTHFPKRKVIAIDIDIRKHNKMAIESHPMINYISLIEGSSVDPAVISCVKSMIELGKTVMVVLDSCHSHSHVLAELNAYCQHVTKGSYCIVHDTGIEFCSDYFCTDRPWGKGNNPKTAVDEYLRSHPEFIVDENIEKKMLCTSAPGGWLLRVS